MLCFFAFYGQIWKHQSMKFWLVLLLSELQQWSCDTVFVSATYPMVFDVVYLFPFILALNS